MLKNTLIFVTGILIGLIVFSFFVCEFFFFPTPIRIIEQDKTGVNLEARIYSPWLWNKEKTAMVSIIDRKNDGPEYKIRLKGEINAIDLIHSGEDFSLIRVGTYYNNNLEYKNVLYVLRRIPKKDGNESLFRLETKGSVLFASPDESGYFVNDGGLITKYDWNGNKLISTKIPKDVELSETDFSFSGDTKILNLNLYDHNTNNRRSFVWNMIENSTSSKVIND